MNFRFVEACYGVASLQRLSRAAKSVFSRNWPCAAALLHWKKSWHLAAGPPWQALQAHGGWVEVHSMVRKAASEAQTRGWSLAKPPHPVPLKSCKPTALGSSACRLICIRRSNAREKNFHASDYAVWVMKSMLFCASRPCAAGAYQNDHMGHCDRDSSRFPRYSQDNT